MGIYNAAFEDLCTIVAENDFGPEISGIITGGNAGRSSRTLNLPVAFLLPSSYISEHLHSANCPGQGQRRRLEEKAGYAGHKFWSLLHDCDVTQSFSTPGVPCNNAPMESFFDSLKTEEIRRYRYHGISDLAVPLREHLNLYYSYSVAVLPGTISNTDISTKFDKIS